MNWWFVLYFLKHCHSADLRMNWMSVTPVFKTQSLNTMSPRKTRRNRSNKRRPSETIIEKAHHTISVYCWWQCCLPSFALLPSHIFPGALCRVSVRRWGLRSHHHCLVSKEQICLPQLGSSRVQYSYCRTVAWFSIVVTRIKEINSDRRLI